MKKRGISLIVLVITIIVILILAGIVIFGIGNSGILDKSKKAKFMNDYTSIQEIVNVYAAGKYNATTGEFELPLKGYLTDADKSDIINNVPTLNTKIEELSGPIDIAKLAWIDSSSINATLSKEKEEKGYIIDVTSGQIYDYIGDVFEGMRWHTLDGGVTESSTPQTEVVELWDGWINLTLYYPAGSTDKKWRLGTEGELRTDPITMWKNYTGPIRVPLDRVKDVWIKYKIDGKDVTIPPAGTLLVDIIPDKTGTTKVPEVNVSINYDESATTKEYRIGGSGWITYNGPFKVTENCVIEARAKKLDTVYNTDGTVLATRNVAGKDAVYISNIGIEEINLEAPTIARLDPVGTEKARVQVTYPSGAVKKIYKVNYGVEQDYTDIINVDNFGTYIIAYYYDASGKRSKSTSIYINDTSTGTTAETAKPYDPNSLIPTMSNDILAPTINVSPTALATEVQVSVAAPANAYKLYIKLGRYGEYQEYTTPITVKQNMEVYAYYRTYDGEKSQIANASVSNIKVNNKPYVYINASPYPWSGSYGASSVTVTINTVDANTIEYSEDGIVYQPYTVPFEVTENKRIYARGTNAYGVTETSLNITNIGKVTPPTPIKNLSIDISVNPEPTLATTRVAKATVTIEYDTAATEKYYTIGRYGALQTYTGPFDVTSSCTVYAYAKGTNAEGKVYKKIDNVSNGISEPEIVATPSNGTGASKVSVSIAYDKYATVKQYSLNGGPLRDYTAAFDITTNGTTVYAYSENELGQKSESTYIIQNIVPEPPMLLLDKGDYYLLKLNYPIGSSGREYKWKADGTWGTYKDAGILLIKPQFKDKVIKDGTLVKIEDENGNMVTFTGDYYLIDVPISELFENLFMRWDREPLTAPQIVLNTTDPALQVTATITYPTGVVKQQYKILKPGEVSSNWQDYTGPIKIDKNNTVIYARGMDETEVWSKEGIKKVTNIDEVQPVIKLTSDLNTAQQKVPVKVNVTDDVAVGTVKWAPGIQGESYFANSGTEILNDSIVNITENGYYTFYAEDKVGNKQVYTLNVTNVDLTAPAIDIVVSPETTVGLNANITINYGDSTIKQYKVGTNNSTWTNYTNAFNISSYTILSNNWQNSDGTVTIYAKGKDTAGNEIIVQKKAVSLDLDKPNIPVINSNSGYATLTSYGATFDKATTITYDTRTDIDNYYSIDNGITWLKYTGQFDMVSGTVIAKSIKKNTGLEVSVSKTISMPGDALGPQAYDNNDTTSATNGWIKLDSSIINKKVRMKLYFCSIDLYAPDKVTLLQNIRYATSGETTITIPQNCEWIKITPSNTGGGIVYEMQVSNEPTFTATNGYMLLTADPTKAIKQPYQMVTVNYFSTSVQRLYKIGTTGDWKSYLDQPIKVDHGQTIYAKGIDQYGNETRTISSYTANVTDAMKMEVYDGNDTTSMSASTGVNYDMEVDSSMQGKNIRVRWQPIYTTMYLRFLDGNKQEISYVSINQASVRDDILTIPANTKWIRCQGTISGGGYTNYLYEIQPSNEPTFNATNGYMLLTSDPSKAIKNPYQMVTVNYFPTSVQKLYRIGTSGAWLNYQNQPIKVDQGQTIYAKGIDQYGNETRIISSYTPTVPDALGLEVYDGNDSTYVGIASNKYMEVDNSMLGKNIRLKFRNDCVNTSMTAKVNISFLDINKQQISIQTWGYGTYDLTIKVPENAKWLVYTGTPYSYYNPYLYEIQPTT